MKNNSHIYAIVLRNGRADYLFLQTASNLDEAVSKCWQEWNKPFEASVRMKPVLWKKMSVPMTKTLTTKPRNDKGGSSKRQRTSKASYIQNLSLARDKFCKTKAEKQVIDRIIKRVNKR